MIGLVVSELLRARSRRLVVVAFVAVVAVNVVVMTIATLHSVRPSPSQLAQDQQRYDADLKACMGPSGPTSPPPGYPDVESFCREVVAPPGANTGANVLTLHGLDRLQQGTAAMTAMLAVVLGATLIGADLSAGTMGTLLVWEPRRVRVFLIRAAVVAAVVFAFVVGVQAVLVLAYRLGVALRGVSDAPGWLGLAVGTTARIGVIAMVWGTLAYVAASLTRTTGGGMGVMALELVAIEGFWRANQQSIQRWTLIQNATAFVSRTPYVTSPQPMAMGVSRFAGAAGMTTPNEALLTLLAYVAVALLVGLVVFARRDVT